MNKTILCFFCFLFLLPSCRKNQPEKPASIQLTIRHSVEGNLLVVDTMRYVNAAGNPFLITEIQWFLSHLALQKSDGSLEPLADDEGIYYLDTDLSDTWTIHSSRPINPGVYTGLKFVFGLNQTDNTSGRFVNPPESFMFWPEQLGGGYHYMKLNGKWRRPDGLIAPFNFHLGIGQVYDSITDAVRFVQNYFEVELPCNLQLKPEKQTSVELEMKVEQWFSARHPYDFNFWGGHIMQNQAAMQQACENGKYAFAIHILNASE